MNKYRFIAVVNNQDYFFDAYGDNLNQAKEEAGWMITRKLNVSISDISKLMGYDEKTLSIFNFKMGLHKAKYLKSQWYNYIVPKRLTFVHNPACYKWMFWYIAPKKTE